MDDPLGLWPAHREASSPAWAMPGIEPTNFIALIPGDAPPPAESVTDAVQRLTGEPPRSIVTIPPPDAEIEWAIGVEGAIPERPEDGLVIWAQAARPVGAEEPADPTARSCRWAIGIEAPLDQDDPLSAYSALLRFLAKGWPEVHSVLDVNTGLWRNRSGLAALLDGPVSEPPVNVLWIVKALAQDDAVQLHTQGLARCGLPNFAMIGVPTTHGSTAISLLDELAALALDGLALPDPGQPLEIGPELGVALRPGQGDGDHAPIAVVGGVDEGEIGYPASVIERIERGESAIYRSSRATRRQAQLARATWSELVVLAPRLTGHDTEAGETGCFVKASFGGAGVGDREHAWLAIDSVDPDGANGQLIDQPSMVTDTTSETRRVSVEQVSDWQVVLREGRFGPDDLAELRAVLTPGEGSA